MGWGRIFLDWVVGFEAVSPPSNYAREGMAGRVASKSSVECVNAVHGDHSSVVYGNLFTLSYAYTRQCRSQTMGSP